MDEPRPRIVVSQEAMLSARKVQERIQEVIETALRKSGKKFLIVHRGHLKSYHLLTPDPPPPT